MIQCQKCNIIGGEVDHVKEKLEQENIVPNLLEVEKQAIKGHVDCKSAANKRRIDVITFRP